MFKTSILILILLFVSGCNTYYINDYGWKPYTRGGLGFTNFGGGTDGPLYQYEQTFSYSPCSVCSTQYAKASDFGSIGKRHLHLDPMRDYHRDPEAGEHRNPDWD